MFFKGLLFIKKNIYYNHAFTNDDEIYYNKSITVIIKIIQYIGINLNLTTIF